MTDPGSAYSYDEVPYSNHPFPQSHPDRLATIATLFGLQPQSIENCRVLELGSGRGGNLLPMAEQLPGSEFVGVELSAVQVVEAQQLIEQADLRNISLRQMNILDVDASLGKFDYIIAHGVFSWVPYEVQEKILAISSALLKPQGVAYISYNTYPGWSMRGMIRDMMLYHSSRYPDAQTKLQESRNLLDFLAKNASPQTAFGMLLKSESEGIRQHEDAYLYHDHLENVNLPIYFHQFMSRAEARGLQYLGEAVVKLMWTGNVAPDVAATFRRIATSLVQLEQYLDFTRNRMFRQTLLCHRAATVNRELTPAALEKFYIAAPLIPTDPPSSTVTNNVSTTFRHAVNGLTFETAHPLYRSAMLALGRHWPACLRFAELFEIARKEATIASTTSPAALAAEKQQLGAVLLQCYVASLIELRTHPTNLVTQPGDRPQASQLARLQAAQSSTVTTLRHERRKLADFSRELLLLLDGTRTRADLQQQLNATPETLDDALQALASAALLFA